MEYNLLLDRNENVRKVEAEEQSRFILSVIEALGIPFEYDTDAEFTPLDKIRLKKALAEFNIAIIDDMAGSVKIYLERELIAEWEKASYLLREDPSALDRRQRLYIEMRCSWNCQLMETPTDTESTETPAQEAKA